MRTLFFGTPAIAVPALEALAGLTQVVAVVCQPDRPAGRGLELRPPPTKVRAAALGIAVVQPAKIRTPEFATWMKDQHADFALVMAYGRILPPSVLEAPRRGCLNLHASLLPAYRGAAPIQRAIAQGERATGISLMQMDEGCDTGPVYSEHRIQIEENETADELAQRLGELAAEVVGQDVLRAAQGELIPRPQEERLASQAPILRKEEGEIRWHQSARAVHNHIRAMTSWPGAFTRACGKLFKVLQSRVHAEDPTSAPAGTVIRADRRGIVVACERGSVEVLRGQTEGRKPLDAKDLVSGRAVELGSVLG